MTLLERVPRIRGRLSQPSVMQFYSGPPVHFLSGVDTIDAIQRAFEDVGVVFLSQDDVQLRGVTPVAR